MVCRPFDRNDRAPPCLDQVVGFPLVRVEPPVPPRLQDFLQLGVKPLRKLSILSHLRGKVPQRREDGLAVERPLQLERLERRQQGLSGPIFPDDERLRLAHALTFPPLGSGGTSRVWPLDVGG
jgi:hypothetical protein